MVDVPPLDHPQHIPEEELPPNNAGEAHIAQADDPVEEAQRGILQRRREPPRNVLPDDVRAVNC